MIAALIPGLISLIGKFADGWFADKAQAEQFKAKFADFISAYNMAELQGAVSIILAEAGGTGLKANWRPILMLVCIFIVFNNYVLAPYMDAIFHWKVALQLDEHIWSLIDIGVGGYVVGRSVEKTAGNMLKAIKS